MGKVRTKIIGDLNLEKEQKIAARDRKAKKGAKKISVSLKESIDRATEAEETKEMIDKEEIDRLHEERKTKQSEKEKKETVRKRIKKISGKNIQKARKLVEKGKFYSLEEAINMLKKISFAKFDESVELHINTTTQGIRGETNLPYNLGKQVKAVVLDDKIMKEIEGGKINFDVLIAKPSQMPQLAKFARILGPKGLMPNPKTGTVTDEVDKVLMKYNSGLVRFKSEPKFPIIHQVIGRLSNKNEELKANIEALIRAVGKKNIKSVFICASMSPAIKIRLDEI